MMSAIHTIQRVLDSSILMPQLTMVPAKGATSEEIRGEEAALHATFCLDHSSLLRRWNGICLEVIRFFGCGSGTGEIGRLAELQLDVPESIAGAIVIGTDPCGFVYWQKPSAEVFSLDTDGFEVTRVGDNLDDFISRVVFGRDAASFAGDEWLSQLKRALII